MIKVNKLLKRIFAIMFVLLTIFVVCYILHTIKLISGPEVSYETIQKSAYKSKNNTILVLSENNVWYFTNDDTYTCTLENYENSVLTIKCDNKTFAFKVIDEYLLYDLQEEEFLRRGDG